jgi:putative intracellular protease/amidase
MSRCSHRVWRRHVVIALTLVSVMLLATGVRAQSAAAVDFDAAMKGLGFDPAKLDGNLDAGPAGNGILDADEMALVAAILTNASLDLRATGGADHGTIAAAFAQARQAATTDIGALSSTWPTAVNVAAGYALLGKGSFDSYNAMSTGFGAPLKSDYSRALAVGTWLAHDGDADGDGVTNRQEYAATIAQGRAAYLRAALDPKVKAAGQTTTAAKPADTRKTLGIVLYPGFEVLDVFGPLEMWAYVPDFKIVMIAEQAGPVKSGQQGVTAVADFSFANAPPLDILMVPGGFGTRAQLQNEALLNYLREQHQRTEFTTSVCTGSALLAKAGILKGRKATSNKGAFALAVAQDPSVDWIVKARWVEDGKIFTSSGVSAGTDMALGLVSRIYGKDRARALARSLEYEWHEDPAVDPFAISAVPQPPKP